MGTKMKGLLKGLRFISQIFDEGKESEIQIGYPTDVKHVAHIGWDGSSVQDSPSWVEFKSHQDFQSAPSSVNGESKENPEIKLVSEDSNRRSPGSQNSPPKNLPRLPKSGGSSTIYSSEESQRRDPSTKSRQSRGNSSKGSKPTRKPKALDLGSDSPSSSLTSIPKKPQRKKSKESGGSSRSRTNIPPIAYTSPFSDPGPDTKSMPGSNDNKLTHTSSFRPLAKEGDKGCSGIS